MADDATREVAAHIEEKVAELVEAGLSEEEARFRAAREFGNAMLITEQSREVWSWGWLDRLGHDLRYARLGLRRDPMLALTAGLTLAICIGANTTVFSIVNSILLRPLPYPGSERIYWVSELLGKEQLEFGLGPDYYVLRERNRFFEEIAAFDTASLNWTGTEKPEQLDAARVTPSFFRLMATQPLVGRYFAEEEHGTKAPAVVVLSYAFWRSRLGSDPRVVGKTITLDRLPRTMAGVMPQGFDYPRGTQIFEPLPMDEATERQRSAMLVVNMLAKVRTGVSQRQLDAEMTRLTQNIRREFYQGAGTTFLARQLQRRLTGMFARPCWC